MYYYCNDTMKTLSHECNFCRYGILDMAANDPMIPSSYPAALDLMLKPLVASNEFSLLSNKNWTAISKNVSGTTPKQVCCICFYL